jgi:hypothetical protein
MISSLICILQNNNFNTLFISCKKKLHFFPKLPLTSAPILVRMVNPVGQAFAAGKQLAATGSFMVNVAKWFATGLAVVAAQFLVVPLVRMIPFLRRLSEGGNAIAGAAMVLVGILLAIPKFTLTRFLAAGIGIAGMLTLVGAGIRAALKAVGMKVEV